MKTRQQYEDEAIGHGVAEDNCIGYSTQRQRFREGWDAAVKEMTRLRDPKKELPQDGEPVLIKMAVSGCCCIASFTSWLPSKFRWREMYGAIELDDNDVIGWRPIIELPEDGEKE